MMWFRFTFILFLCFIVYCGKKNTSLDNEKLDVVSEELTLIPVILDGSSKKEKEISTEKAIKTDFVRLITLSGEIAADPDRIYKISAKLSGRVSEVYFREGDFIKKEKILAVIESPEVARMQSRYLSSLARLISAKKNQFRIKELANLGLASSQESVHADSEMKIAEAENRSDLDHLKLYGIVAPKETPEENWKPGAMEIKATQNGTVISRNAHKGMQADPGTELATIADISEVWFQVRIFEKDLDRIHTGDKANIQFNAFPQSKFPGTLVYIGNQTDPNSRTITGRIILKNKGNRIKLGFFGTAILESVKPETIIVSNDALFEVSGKKYVFVEEKPDQFFAREITLGETSDTHTEVVNGISQGEFIAVKNIYLLKSILLKSTFGGD